MTKEHILSEIRRTAKANGGIPLGRLRFLRETGISETDWRGRYWARWSDALRDAGFAPNQLQGPRDESTLLSRYADLARKLGRLPVYSELDLARRDDPSFPDSKTYQRFGKKAELVQRLASYCREQGGYDDVIALCEGYTFVPHVPSKQNETGEDAGFVYLLKSGRFYKIGRSNAAGRRERELAIQLPEKAKTLHVIRTDDPCGIEAYWHRRFEEKRKNGEWFELNAADVRAFRRRRFM